LLVSYDPLRGLRGDIVTADGTIVGREVVEYSVALDPKAHRRARTSHGAPLPFARTRLSDEERRAAQARIEDRRTRAEEGLAPEQRYLLLKKGVPEGLTAELGQRWTASFLLPRGRG